MGQPEQIEVVIRSDFTERQTRAEPVQALAELIWNSVDADATSVAVDFALDDLAGGLSKIVVSDDWHGLPRAEAGASSVVSEDRGSALRAVPRPSDV